MAGEFILKQSILLLRPRADVVDDQRCASSRNTVAHNHDMRAIPHEARHQITRFEILPVTSFFHRKTLPLKITAQVWLQPMVDVFVRFFSPQFFRY